VNERHPSIVRVLGVRLALVSAIFLAAMVLVLQSRLQIVAESMFHGALQEEVESVAKDLELAPDGSVVLRQPITVDDRVETVRYRVVNRSGKYLLGVGHWVGTLPTSLGMAPETDQPDRVRYFRAGPPDLADHIVGATLATKVGGTLVYIQAFENLDQHGVLLDDLVSNFFYLVGWLLVPLLALLLAVNIFSVWAELRPLGKVSTMAASIGPETTGKRLPEEGQPAEVLPVIRGVNRALERLDHGFQVQRQFTADAAHELRTPLAVLGAHLDTLGDGKAVVALRQEVATMSRLVGQLLRIAQLDTLSGTPAGRVDLHASAIEAAAALAPLALKEGRSIELTGVERPVWVLGDIEALGQAIRNLIENALNHTPRGTTVEIELGADRSLRISDHGPGIPPEQRELVFRRFWRASRRGGGAGLGLAIVAKVAETHDGTVHVEDAADGGACFVLKFPAPPPAATAPVEPQALSEKRVAAR
jgi:signal transduction histidine kinase